VEDLLLICRELRPSEAERHDSCDISVEENRVDVGALGADFYTRRELGGRVFCPELAQFIHARSLACRSAEVGAGARLRPAERWTWKSDLVLAD
jgi:hypothetical protein